MWKCVALFYPRRYISNPVSSIADVAGFIARTHQNDIFRNGAGWPSLNIPKETLKLYLSYGFTKTKIAHLFNVSRKTIFQRTQAFELTDDVLKYSDIPDEVFDFKVCKVIENFPNCRIRRMKGFLMARNFKLQWERVRSSMWRVDPVVYSWGQCS